MKKKLLLPLSTLLLAGIALSSCSTVKQDVEKRRQDRENSTETTVEETAAADTTETEATTSEETTTEETTVEPSVITVESNMYSDEEAPIVVDWDNYQSADKKPNVFTRMSDEPIDDFTPSEEYGYVMPYIGTRYNGEIVNSPEYEDGTTRTMDKYGFCDSNGRIITDPVFDNVSLFTNTANDQYGPYYIQQGQYPNCKYGLMNIEGTVYTGCVFDHVDLSYSKGEQKIFARSNGELSIFDSELNLIKTLKYKIVFDDSTWLKDESELSISAVIDDRHILICTEYGEYYYVDITTGKIADFQPCIWFEEYNLLITQTREGKEILYQLRDGQGNVIEEGFAGFAHTNVYPVFKDDNGSYHIYDGQGIDRYSYKPAEMTSLRKIGDDLLVKIDKETYCLLDKDFNVIDHEVKGVLNVRGNGDDCLYINNNGFVTDYFTNEKILNGFTKDATVYKYEDITAIVAKESDLKEVILSNGKTVNIRGARRFSFSRDNATGKLYMISVYNDKVLLYDIEEDTEVTLDLQISPFSTCEFHISDNRFYYLDADARGIYDITDPDSIKTIFYYEPLCVTDD